MQKGQVFTASTAGGAVVGLRLTVSRACLGTEVGKGKTYTVDYATVDRSLCGRAGDRI